MASHTFEKLEEEAETQRPAFFPEALRLWSLAWPSTLRLVAYELTFTAVCMFLSHNLGAKALAAGALATSFHHAVGIMPCVGLAGAIDTLCSQEYGRDNRSPLMGTVLLRGMISQTILFIPSAMLHSFSYPILLLFADHNLARDASTLCLWYIPGLLPLTLLENIQRFMSTHEDSKPACVSSLALCVTTVACLYLFIPYLGWGLMGCGVAVSAARLVQVVVWWLYISYSARYQHTYLGINWKAFSLCGLWEYNKLGIPSMISMMMEANCWECLTLFAAHLGYTVAAAQATLVNSLALFYMPVIGLRIALSIRIGNLLGANKPLTAKWVWRYTLVLCVGGAFLTGSIILFGRYFLASLYTDNKYVIQQVSKAALILALFHVADVVQEMGNGVCVGLGKQHLTVVVMLVSLWGIGVPAAFVFGVKLGYGLPGLWGGFGIGVVLSVPVYFVVIWRQNWVTIAAECAERLKICGAESCEIPPKNAHYQQELRKEVEQV